MLAESPDVLAPLFWPLAASLEDGVSWGWHQLSGALPQNIFSLGFGGGTKESAEIQSKTIYIVMGKNHNLGEEGKN